MLLIFLIHCSGPILEIKEWVRLKVNRLCNTGKGTVRFIYKDYVALPQGSQIHLPGISMGCYKPPSLRVLGPKSTNQFLQFYHFQICLKFAFTTLSKNMNLLAIFFKQKFTLLSVQVKQVFNLSA